jgi:aminomethyltransferase
MIDGAREVVQDLAGRGLDPSLAMAVRLFGEWSPPGSEQSFRAEREGVLIVAAPAAVSSTAPLRRVILVVELHRARPRTAQEVELPRRSPNPAWTSGSTARPPGATRCRPASSSR